MPTQPSMRACRRPGPPVWPAAPHAVATLSLRRVRGRGQQGRGVQPFADASGCRPPCTASRRWTPPESQSTSQLKSTSLGVQDLPDGLLRQLHAHQQDQHGDRQPGEILHPAVAEGVAWMSGFCRAMRKPSSVTTEEPASERLLKASAVMAMEPESGPGKELPGKEQQIQARCPPRRRECRKQSAAERESCPPACRKNALKMRSCSVPLSVHGPFHLLFRRRSGRDEPVTASPE